MLVVTHGGALRMLRQAAGGDELGPGMANGEVVQIAVREGTLRGLD